MSGRIPQNFIDDLLDRLDIVEVIDRRVKLKKSGRNFTACCPFHDEKTPSFSVNQEKQFYYCFGCGAGGNAVGFLMDYERLDFPRAIESLADLAGLEVPKEASAFREEPKQKKNIYNILEKAADYFARQLKEHPERQRAVDYLKNRGLSGEICRQFQIGYAPPGWDNLLKELGGSNEDRQLLIDGGMLVEKTEENKCYDRFRDRIIFPIVDSRGRVIAFGGRVLGDDKPKYLNSPETPVFHKSRELYGLYHARKSNRQLQQLLIVEGYMDVVALAQKGLNYAAATLGTATSTDHLKQVYRQCPEVIFCFDGDEAGRKAATRALESALPAMEDGRQARFLFLPQGEDPDSLIRQIGASEFQRLIEQATPLEQYLFDSQSADLDANTLEGKARLSKLTAPLINKIPAGIYKTLLMGELARRTGLSEEKLDHIIGEQQADNANIQRATSQHGQPAAQRRDEHDSQPATRSGYKREWQPDWKESKQPKQRQPLPPRDEIHRDAILYAIGLLLLHPEHGHHSPSYNAPESANDKESLLAEIHQLTHRRPDSTTPMLLSNWQQEQSKSILEQSLSQAQIFGMLGNASADKPGEELADTIAHIQRHNNHRQLDLEVDKLSSASLDQLSPAQKEQLKLLLSQKHS